MTTAYCTIAQVKTSLNIAGSQDDTLLTRIVSGASDWIDRHCGWGDSGFQPSETTRYYDFRSLDEGGDLFLGFPLLTLASLLSGAGVAISTADAQLHPLNATRFYRIHLKTSDWAISSSEDRITVVGKFGYSLLPPSAVVEAAVMLSGWLLKRYQAALQDNSISPELGTVLYGSSMPKQVVEILRQFSSGKRFV